MKNKLNIEYIERISDSDYPNFLYKILKLRLPTALRVRLRKFFLLKRTVTFLRRISFNIYSYFCGKAIHINNNKKSYEVICLKDYLSKCCIEAEHVYATETINTPQPFCTSYNSGEYLISPGQDYQFPVVYLSRITDAEVVGSSNIVFKDKFALVHDLINIERDFMPEELHKGYVFNAKKHQLIRGVSKPSSLVLEEAAVFCDSCAANWSHWLTEVLPRILAFCELEAYRKVPIVIDAALHPNMMECLLMTVGTERKIYAVSSQIQLRVSTAYIISVCGYIPFDKRVSMISKPFHGIFSSAALSLVRDKFFGAVGSGCKSEIPKKIFLRRNSKYRRLINSTDIESSLSSFGYTIIDPEQLSVTEQIELFSQAESIIGPTGAAFANIIFCKPGTDITILIGRSNEMPYWYWQNMACATGNLVNYVLSEGVIRGGVHSDFSVNVSDVIRGVLSNDHSKL